MYSPRSLFPAGACPDHKYFLARNRLIISTNKATNWLDLTLSKMITNRYSNLLFIGARTKEKELVRVK